MNTPLGVLRRVRKARQGVDAAPLALTLVCLGLVSALSSDFVYSPGMYVGFDRAKSPALSRTLEIPEVVTREMARTALTVTLVSTRGTGVYVVGGRVVDFAQLREELKSIADKGGRDRPVLIKADGALMMRDFLRVCEAARDAKFAGVLIAGGKTESEVGSSGKSR
jgi:biopolymer transport protein ExbD